MKKTLAALAVLTAFAGSAMASDVTVYGRIDLGMVYQHSDADINGQDATDKFTMENGVSTGSRFGIKGSEDLGNGYSVNFVLENGFKADSGSLGGKNNRLFDREASLQLNGPFGKLGFGRLAILGTDGGTFNVLGDINSFGTGWGDIGNQGFVMANVAARWDNMIEYRSPSFAGFQVSAATSFGSSEEGSYTENTSKADRYSALAVSYEAGDLGLVLLGETVNEKSFTEKTEAQEDMFRITFGGNYDFQVAKVFGAVHYFKNADKLNTTQFSDVAPVTFDELKGYGLVAGVDVPLAGGTLKGSIGYVDAEDEVSDAEAKGFYVGAGYKYPFSKRTYVYTGIGYDQTKYEWEGGEQKPSDTRVTFGMAHFF